MTLQRGVLRPLRKQQGDLRKEVVADLQYQGWPETGNTLHDGRIVLKIKSIQPAKDGESLADGEYDFTPVTAGLFSVGVVLQLRKSDGDWDWRGK